MSSSVEYQLENNMQLFEVHSLHSHHHADLIGNHTAVTWSLWGPRGCSMPTESPGPVQVQRCGARHEVKREEDGDVPSPSLPFPALDWTGPSLALRSPLFPPSPLAPRAASAPPAPSPRSGNARSAWTGLWANRLPCSWPAGQSRAAVLPRAGERWHRFRPAPWPWTQGRPGRARPPRGAMKTQMASMESRRLFIAFTNFLKRYKR